MSITQSVCNSFKTELHQAVHDLENDVLKIALFTNSASLNASTTAYATTNEVEGTGYVAGGETVTCSLSNSNGVLDVVFDSVSWAGSTITARGAVIYNSSKSNRAILVLNFGQDVITESAAFTITFPAAGADWPVYRFK